MKARQAIPDDALGGARNVKDAVRAAVRSEEARRAIDAIVMKAGFKRFSKAETSLPFEAVVQAVDTFFAEGAIHAPERVIEMCVDHANSQADLLDDIRRSRAFASLREAVATAVNARFPKMPREEIVGRAASMLADEIVVAMNSFDRSKPLDAIKGTEVVVCYIPGLREGQKLKDTMTSHWTQESSVLTVKPDDAFMTFLTLANVTVDEWLQEVEEATGVRLDRADEGSPAWQQERARAWTSASSNADPARPPAVKASRLVEAVDACYLGFTPMIAFNVDAAVICTRDWTRPLGVTGGVLGLHDFENGTGDPLRFDAKIVIDASPDNMMVGEARENDFAQAYGFVRHTFRTKLSQEAHTFEEAPSAPRF